jgi:hypothetical protein
MIITHEANMRMGGGKLFAVLHQTPTRSESQISWCQLPASASQYATEVTCRASSRPRQLTSVGPTISNPDISVRRFEKAGLSGRITC